MIVVIQFLVNIALNNFLSELDERADDPEVKKTPRKTRVAGSTKDCYPPKNVNNWMLSKRWTSSTNMLFRKINVYIMNMY